MLYNLAMPIQQLSQVRIAVELVRGLEGGIIARATASKLGKGSALSAAASLGIPHSDMPADAHDLNIAMVPFEGHVLRQ